MTTTNPTNLAASVRQRLLNHSAKTKQDFQVVLSQYGFERLLYRLGKSPYAGQFTLKGALMFLVWTDEQFRPTRDMDLTSRQKRTAVELQDLFREVCEMSVGDDGLSLLADSVKAEPIRDEDDYGGMRVTLLGRLGNAITPRAVSGDFPVLLDFAAPRIPMYPRETTIAEKSHTIVVRGVLNSRMKDYYDIWALCREFEFDGAILSKAIIATFQRRKTGLPTGIPVGLSDELSSDTAKRKQWSAFIRRTPLRIVEQDMSQVVATIRGFLMPPYEAAATGKSFNQTWKYDGPCHPRAPRLRLGLPSFWGGSTDQHD
jgi:hypothetical protein